MADGRDLIEETYQIVVEIAARKSELGPLFPEQIFSEFEGEMEAADKWIKLCRRKVWLRGAEGTRMAEGCLAAAHGLQAALGDPPAALEAAADLSLQLETLARVIATKSQVLT
jgi:hypothetical protein